MINYKEEFKITEEDLNRAHEILFSGKGTFDDEKKKIIQSLESCYIEASPGSGKTTTLVAKLIILAKKLKKYNYNKGICILTHTNIGIDIIKEKLGSEGDILFKYPNFVGTLQSFIDIYLTIPFFKLKYKKKIERIDDDVVNNYCIGSLLSNKALNSYLKYSNIDITNIYYKFSEESFLNKKNRNFKLKKGTSKSYIELYSRIEKGILRYEEAIQLGKIYLDEYPNLRNYFSERFFLVQIDEMQDTSNEAFEILENLFDKKRTIVQYIGDRNQNILDGNEEWCNSSSNCYNLNSSRRFGNNIAEFLNNIINDTGNPIIGNPIVKDYKPILLLYDSLESNEENGSNKIFDKFVEIIKKKELDKKDGYFKVIGHVGIEREDKKNTIPSYFYNFSKKNSNKVSSLKSAINKNKKTLPENKRIINVLKDKISYFFKRHSIDKNRFEEYLQENNHKLEFHKIIYEYVKTRNEQELFEKLFNFTEEATEIKLSRNIFDSIFTSLKGNNNNSNENSKIDIYSKDTVNLEVSTVHSIKGETHLATLYLDTYHKKYDVSEYLINLITENLTATQKNQIENKKRNRLLFVGSSRPRHLLCFACQNTILELSSSEREKLENTFEMIEI